jgi:hypothetical protein
MGMGGRIERVSFACACGVALVFGAAVPGDAELSAIEIVTSVGGTDSNSPKNLDVACPAGTFALGGGGTITGDRTGISAVASLPVLDLVSSDPVGWFYEATELVSVASGWGLVPRVVCGRADGLEIATATSVSSSSPKSVEVSCPTGKEALSGAFELLGSTVGVAVYETFPTMDPGTGAPTGWSVYAAEKTSTALSWSVRAEVLCANETILPFRAELRFSSDPYKYADLSCPAHWVATGGGVTVGGSLVDWVDGSSPSSAIGEWFIRQQRDEANTTEVDDIYYVLCPEPGPLAAGAVAAAAVATRRRSARIA